MWVIMRLRLMLLLWVPVLSRDIGIEVWRLNPALLPTGDIGICDLRRSGGARPGEIEIVRSVEHRRFIDWPSVFWHSSVSELVLVILWIDIGLFRITFRFSDHQVQLLHGPSRRRQLLAAEISVHRLSNRFKNRVRGWSEARIHSRLHPGESTSLRPACQSRDICLR